MSSGIVALDERGFVTQNNQVALKLLGLEIFTHVNQLERVSPALKLLVTEIRPGESQRVTFMNERGSVQLLVSASRILLKNKPITLLVMNDIENELDEKEIDSWVRLIRVRDNGPGISPEIMNEIFVPFFTTKEEGSGIGLSVSRQIMRMHGGNLKVSSIEGKETVFTIII